MRARFDFHSGLAFLLRAVELEDYATMFFASKWLNEVSKPKTAKERLDVLSKLLGYFNRAHAAFPDREYLTLAQERKEFYSSECIRTAAELQRNNHKHEAFQAYKLAVDLDAANNELNHLIGLFYIHGIGAVQDPFAAEKHLQLVCNSTDNNDRSMMQRAAEYLEFAKRAQQLRILPLPIYEEVLHEFEPPTINEHNRF
jgi:hypothetical protein